MSNTIVVTDDNFKQLIQESSKPILIDYYADWCVPCKQLSPILDAVSEELSDKITIGKLNIDVNTDTPKQYGVRGIPTLMLFKDGNVVSTKVGGLTKPQLMAFIAENT